jgi:endonuclease YncB( thermonuclease family)
MAIMMHVLFIGSLVVALTWQSPAGDVLRGVQGPILVAEEVFKGTVTAVEDGDSLFVKTASERTAVHLAGVDAPEMSQPGGPEAKKFLSDLVLGKTVTVRLQSVQERSARIEADGSDVSAVLIRRGMAWHCPRFSNDRDLTVAEAEARASKRGLWSVERPTPPWLHRGAGACWRQQKEDRTSRPDRRDFSGSWIALSPSLESGRKVIITQDAVSVTIEHLSDLGIPPLAYKLNGPTSRAFTTPDGPVDVVAKARWSGDALIVEERRWIVRGQEPTSLRQTLWLDDRGLLNLEVASPRPMGEHDATWLVLRRDVPSQPR